MRCLNPSKISGSFTAPPSKSDAHRALICAALSRGKSSVVNVGKSDDILATLSVLSAMGAIISLDENRTLFSGFSPVEQGVADCRESGTTLRLLVPVCSALGLHFRFIGEGRLPERPLWPLIHAMEELGATSDYRGTLPFTLDRALEGGTADIPGDISSQFISGLLLAAPLTEKGIHLNFTSPLQSKSYLQMTSDTMRRFGIDVALSEQGVSVPQNRYRCNPQYIVEGDWSSAAFFLCAAAISGFVSCEGLSPSSLQGDKAIFSILEKIGALVSWENKSISITSQFLEPVEIDAENVPDLIPVLSVVLGLCAGRSVIHNIERLRLKESDRVLSTIQLITDLGGDAWEEKNSIIIDGVSKYQGGSVQTYGDHRIAMAAAVASFQATAPIVIDNPECVKKSYPDFWEDYQKLGGDFQ